MIVVLNAPEAASRNDRETAADLLAARDTHFLENRLDQLEAVPLAVARNVIGVSSTDRWGIHRPYVADFCRHDMKCLAASDHLELSALSSLVARVDELLNRVAMSTGSPVSCETS